MSIRRLLNRALGRALRPDLLLARSTTELVGIALRPAMRPERLLMHAGWVQGEQVGADHDSRTVLAYTTTAPTAPVLPRYSTVSRERPTVTWGCCAAHQAR